jgi:DNA-binding transcriptional regulator GbsR (MarR family)
MSQALDSDLNPVQKFVLLVMANYANDEGQNVYPSHELIAQKTSLTRRTVVTTVKQLSELGYVSLEGKRGNRQNVYTLNVEKFSQMCKTFTPEGDSCETASHQNDDSCEARSHNPLMIKELKDKELKDERLKDSAQAQISQQAGNLYPMMEALAYTCRRVLLDNRQILGRYAKSLTKLGYTSEDVRAFSAWWYSNDWRGKLKQAPTPAQVQELIGTSKSKMKSNQPKDGYLGDNLGKWRAMSKRTQETYGDDDEDTDSL